MKVVCIIPARGGSKGIPGKNIVDLAGKPLIAWSIQHALASKWVAGRAYVSSDSDEILAVATNAGAKPIRRPSALATDAASSESALEHALQEIEKEDPEEIDYVVFLQATSPVRHPHDIDRALQVIVDEGADSLMSACPSLDFFLWGKTKSGLASLNYDYRNRKRRQDLETTYLENGSIYVFKPEMFRRERNRLGGKICVYEMDKNHSNQIDEPEDLDFCEYLLKKYYP